MITNRHRFPNVDFLPQPREIGTVGSSPLMLVGYEQGTNSAVVAVQRPGTDQLHAVPLYELLSHSFDPISIVEDIRPGQAF
ncbi:MAG: hypothetical protein SNJ57_10230 [Cyanobacteriota bacterium]